METLEEKIQAKLAELEKHDPLFYAFIKRRTKDPLEFIASLVVKYCGEGVDMYPDINIKIAIDMLKQLVAGNVYKK